MDINNFKAVKVDIEEAIIDNQKCIRVQKPSSNLIPDDNTFAKYLPINNFHNGSIRVQVYSKLKEDAPDYSRGFIGITFRSSENDQEFESFYVRPTNGRTCIDPIRYKHTVQYFACPKYTFSYFRENNIEGYENHCDIDLEEWIDLRVDVNDSRADFYVNDERVLVVNDLKLPKESRGSVGLYVDIGTDGYFKDLEVTCFD